VALRQHDRRPTAVGHLRQTRHCIPHLICRRQTRVRKITRSHLDWLTIDIARWVVRFVHMQSDLLPLKTPSSAPQPICQRRRQPYTVCQAGKSCGIARHLIHCLPYIKAWALLVNPASRHCLRAAATALASSLHREVAGVWLAAVFFFSDSDLIRLQPPFFPSRYISLETASKESD